MSAKFAYEIFPALRMIERGDNLPVIRLDREKDLLRASHSLNDFKAWQKTWTGMPVSFLDLAEETETEVIINIIKKSMAADTGLLIIRKLGLIAWGPNAAVVNRLLSGEKIPDKTKNTQASFSGKVIIITGAAQGFGKGLAEHFAEDGALVVVADINKETGEKSVNELIEKTGNEGVVFIPVDVTDSVSVDSMIQQTVFCFGGLDLFVSNAGVLKAGGLETLEEKDFDFVTGVNYKGLYLGTKYASRVMKTQHKYKSDHFMDIIQINSKSGLQGSNRNFAYAGSKFGSIGLIQSFALELVPENIKVNAVCPGNFFDGPLWSDPDRGLFIQYLRAGKIPGAKTVEDVKKHYESLVPMKRGCYVNDVYKAVAYLVDQTYETGQALPVTGGQVMLK